MTKNQKTTTISTGSRSVPSQTSRKQTTKPRSVSAPQAKGNVVKGVKPKFVPGPRGSILVSHREFIADIFGSTAYYVQTFPVNPGLPMLFNWLSGLALNYETYRFRKLQFLYFPSCPTTTAGTISFAFDSNAQDSAPISKMALCSLAASTRVNPWNKVVLNINAENLHKAKCNYVRSTGVSNTTDIKTYDIGNLFIATMGNTTSDLGDLWVEYEVELATPQNSIMQLTSSKCAKITSANGSTSGVIGTSYTVTGGLPLVLTNASFQVLGTGSFLVELECLGSTLSGANLNCNSSTNLVTVPWGTAYFFTLSGVSVICLLIQVNDPTTAFTYTISGTGAIIGSITRITPYTYSLG
jgi:hypothetical protein